MESRRGTVNNSKRTSISFQLGLSIECTNKRHWRRACASDHRPRVVLYGILRPDIAQVSLHHTFFHLVVLHLSFSIPRRPTSYDSQYR